MYNLTHSVCNYCILFYYMHYFSNNGFVNADLIFIRFYLVKAKIKYNLNTK